MLTENQNTGLHKIKTAGSETPPRSTPCPFSQPQKVLLSFFPPQPEIERPARHEDVHARRRHVQYVLHDVGLAARDVDRIPLSHHLLSLFIRHHRELSLQHDQYLHVRVVVARRCVERRLHEVLDRDRFFATQTHPPPVLLRLVALRVLKTNHIHRSRSPFSPSRKHLLVQPVVRLLHAQRAVRALGGLVALVHVQPDAAHVLLFQRQTFDVLVQIPVDALPPELR